MPIPQGHFDACPRTSIVLRSCKQARTRTQGDRRAIMTVIGCKICSEKSVPFATATVLARHEARFVQCTSCGFMCIEAPTWRDEAYAQPINSTDIGLLSRNVSLARRSARLVSTFFDASGDFLDFGGGYGVFVRLMRDQGFRFQLHDEHTPNLFAPGLSVSAEAMSHYELITAFEVIEHLLDPLDQVRRLLDHTGSLLFTTELLPTPAPPPNDWWYYGLEHGQHVSFFTQDSLRELATRTRRRYLTDGGTLHLLTDRTMSDRRFKLISSSYAGMLLDPLLARRFSGRSLLQSDYEIVRDQQGGNERR